MNWGRDYASYCSVKVLYSRWSVFFTEAVDSVWTFFQDTSELSWSPSGSQWTPSLLIKCRWIHFYCISLQSCQDLLAYSKIFMDVSSCLTKGIFWPTQRALHHLSFFSGCLKVASIKHAVLLITVRNYLNYGSWQVVDWVSVWVNEFVCAGPWCTLSSRLNT